MGSSGSLAAHLKRHNTPSRFIWYSFIPVLFLQQETPPLSVDPPTRPPVSEFGRSFVKTGERRRGLLHPTQKPIEMVSSDGAFKDF